MPNIGVVVVLAGGLLGVLALFGVGRVVGVDPRPAEVLPFQSGALPREHALSRFHARWYPATLLFLAFDVEMLFMYPWAVVAVSEGGSAVAEMFLFLALLLGGVVWAWREGALRWV